MNKTLLKVLVGSQAHGLATPESDNDYRGVFVTPTSEVVSLGGIKAQTSWIEGKEDDTSWEIGKFLTMATKCNPTVLEVFLAPVISEDVEGKELRELFQYVWNSTDVMNAFIGYGINQRKKFLENKDDRQAKYACAYLRTLYQAFMLLSTGTFPVRIIDTEVGAACMRFKQGFFTVGEVMQICTDWELRVRKAYELFPKKETNFDKVNEFLIKVRKSNW